jgi:hypothetical protein
VGRELQTRRSETFVASICVLGLLLALGACSSSGATDARPPAIDLSAPDAGLDQTTTDVAIWPPCSEPDKEQVCTPKTGGACCPKAGAAACGPGHACVAVTCPPDAGMASQTDAACPPGRFCLSQGQCGCIPSLGAPCPCRGTCVTSCATKRPSCPW